MVGMDTLAARHTLAATDLGLGYGDRRIVSDLTVEIPAGRVSVIIGANGCGKSTLLRGLARLLPPSGGAVLLDGRDIPVLVEPGGRHGDEPAAPVAGRPRWHHGADLVGRGRYPHRAGSGAGRPRTTRRSRTRWSRPTPSSWPTGRSMR